MHEVTAGALCIARNIDLDAIDPDEPEEVASAFGIAQQLAREVVFMNDEYSSTPEARWKSMEQWVKNRILYIVHHTVAIPFLACMLAAIFVGGAAVPIAVVTWLISFAL